MKRSTYIALLLVAGSTAAANNALADNDLVARGRYVVEITGCNDCHTPGYAEKGGQLPLDQWLTGNPVGFNGPWGTTFPANLRLLMQNLTEDEWVQKARTFEARPPMPWFNVRFMSETDQRAVYQFIKSLGPAGKPAPAFVPAQASSEHMYISFVPVSPRER